MNDSDNSHRPLQVLYTISDVSCSSSHQPKSYRLLMGLSFKGDGQGRAWGRTSETFSSGISVQAGASLQKDPLSCGGKQEGLGTACAECVAVTTPGCAGIRMSGAEASFEAQAHQLLPSCTRYKGLQIRTWKPTKIPEDPSWFSCA